MYVDFETLDHVPRISPSGKVAPAAPRSHAPAGHLALLSYGLKTEYLRTVTAILSFYANLSGRREDFPTVLFTDAPEFFRDYLRELPIEYEQIRKEELEAWRERYGCHHAIKIVMIERALQRFDAPVMFVDSDTFFTADGSPLFRHVRDDRAIMHTAEYSFTSDYVERLEQDHPIKLFRDRMTGRTFYLSSGNTVEVAPDSLSWNAGAIVLHPSHARLLPDVYELTRRFYEGSGCHTAEQYAFSIVLGASGTIKACDEFLVHYWEGVSKPIADVILKRRVENIWNRLPLNERLCSTRSLAVTLRQAFEEHVLALKHDTLRYFREGDSRTALNRAFRALLKDPFDLEFIKSIYAYRSHVADAFLRKTKRMIFAS
ncbi:MAG: hypothetical protein ACREIA_24945 [Opitutaceae bacterium]